MSPRRSIAALAAIVSLALVAAPSVSPALAQQSESAIPAIPGKVAVFNGLNKVTARISRIVAPVDQPVEFGSLVITVRYCESAPPEEAPEARVFVEVDQTTATAPTERVFDGWMFASSPGINALDHAIYDIWPVSCSDQLPKPEAEETTAAKG